MAVTDRAIKMLKCDVFDIRLFVFLSQRKKT